MSSQLTQRMFGRGLCEAPSAAREIRGKNIAATDPEPICRNRRLFILFLELVINVTSTHQYSVTGDLQSCHCEAFEKGRGNLIETNNRDCFASLAMTLCKGFLQSITLL